MSGKRRVRDWQKTDPHLRSHPTFVRFQHRLGVSPVVAHGLLAGLWAFAFNFAHDGDLSRFNAEDIAIAVGWEDDPQTLMDALDVGFVTKGIIHDWHEWGGALFFDRATDAQRKYDDYHSEQEDSSEVLQGENRRMREDVPEKRREEKKPPSSPPKGDERFEVFWAAYPPRPHNNRPKAVRAWAARIKAGEEADRLIAASRHYATARAAQDPQFTMLAATFLGPDLRYEEFVDPPKNGNGNGRAKFKDYATQGEPWRYCDDESLVTP